MTNIVQSSFRIRTDATAAQGGTPVWAAAENANVVIASNTKFRIRFSIVNYLGTGTGNYNLACYVSINGGSYTWGVPDLAFTDATLGHSPDGQLLTTSYLTGSGSFSGVGKYSTSLSKNEVIAASSYIEMEFGLQFIGPVCDGDHYSFRLYNSALGIPIDGYTNTPSFIMANKGALARTEGNDLLTAAGDVPPAGRLSVLEMSDAVAGTGTVLWHVGILAQTEADDVLTGSGVATLITAELAQTEADDALVAGYAFALPIGGVDGHLMAVEANDVVSGGVGTVTGVVGSLAPSEDDDVLTGSGGLTITAVLAGIENNDIVVSHVLLFTDQWVEDGGCAPSMWTPIDVSLPTPVFPPIPPPGPEGVDEVLQMEQLNVPGVNMISNFSRTPDMNLCTLTVDGRPFYPVGFSPDFSVTGNAVTWLNPSYSVVPGSTVIAAYSWTPST